MDLDQLTKQIADIERGLTARLAGLNAVDAVRGLESGVLGEIIKLRNKKSQVAIRGRVVARGVAELVLNWEVEGDSR